MKRALVLLGIIILAGLYLAAQGVTVGSILGVIEAAWRLLQRFVEGYPNLAPFLFSLSLCVLTAALLPVVPILTIVGGALFGLVPAALLSTFSTTIGSLITFLATRTVLGEPLKRRYRSAIQRFYVRVERQGSLYLLALRILPVVPVGVVNIMAGAAAVRVVPFLWTTAAGLLPASLVYAGIGAAGLGDRRWPEAVTPQLVATFAVMAVLTFAAGLVLRRATVEARDSAQGDRV